MPGAGQLDRKVRLERYTVTRGETGEEIEEYQPITTVWAAKREMTGRERFAAEQEIAERSAVFTIRYRRGLQARDRIVEDSEGLIWDIEGIGELPGTRRMYLEITASVQGV